MGKKMKLWIKSVLCLLIAAILFSVFQISPQRAFAAPLQLKDAVQGSIVSYGGKDWIVLDPTTGYVITKTIQDAVSFDPNGTNTFDPVDEPDHNNIAYWLNDATNGFLHTIIQGSGNPTWIVGHDWTTGPQGSEASSAVHNVKIGLLSSSEWDLYKSQITRISLTFYSWWLRTPDPTDTSIAGSASCDRMFGICSSGSFFIGSTIALRARPALYLNPDLYIAGGDGSATPYTLTTMSGNGTASSPYIVMTPQDLSDIRYNMSAHYELGADIDLASYVYLGETASDGFGWMPIGTDTVFFTGTFDGGGYSIRNLRINRPSTEYVGLFGAVSGTLTNIQLLDINVNGDRYVGGLTGMLLGLINNSCATGRVTGNDTIGGLVGDNQIHSAITNVCTNVIISGGSPVGGLVGRNNGEITNAYATGDVTGTSVGGLIGSLNLGSSISNAYAIKGRLIGISTSPGPNVTSSYWDIDASQMVTSPKGIGKTTTEMKNLGTFTGWDFATVWGIREGETYPYLLTFKPKMKLSALARTTYNLTSGQDQLAVTGTVLDFSFGEALTIKYDIKNSVSESVSSVTYSVYANGTDQSIARSFLLTGLPVGTYTLNVTASDTFNHVDTASPLTFTIIDQTAPTVALSSTASGTVNAAFPITITFSEPVHGFTSGDIVVGNGNLSNLTTVTAATYTATITPTTSGQAVTVNVPTNAASDGAGNGNTLSNTLSFMYDTTKPVVTFGGFTANQPFTTPPSSVTVSVSEAVYWVAGGAQLTASNALPLISMEKDNVAFSAYTASYDAASRTYTLAFDGTLGDGIYKVNVAGNLVKNANNNTLEAASASFTLAVPVVTDMAANPSSFTSVGGSTNVTITGTNFTGQTVKVYMNDVESATANISSTTSASATIVIPQNTTWSAKQHILTVYVNGVKVAGKSATVTVNGIPVPSYSSPPAIDLNGETFDPTKIDTAKPSVTLEVTPKDGVAYISIPASILTGLEGKNATFMIEIKTPYGSYQVPVNLASLIPGLIDLLATNNLKAEDISFKITLTDKSGNKDIQTAFTNGLPNGKALGSIVDFSIEIMNTKSGKTIGTADKFTKALTRVIPMPKNLNNLPEQWGAFRYNETTKKFEFVAAKNVRIDGIWYVMINSFSNSTYVVAENAVSFSDVKTHWGLPYVQLAAAKGLVEGVGGGQYVPDKPVTRAEFTAMLVRALGRGTTTASSAPYDDVKPGSWYYSEVNTAQELGLLDIVSGKSFMPDQPLTREEMASMLAAIIALEKLPMTMEFISLHDYNDSGSVSTAFVEDVRLMVKLKIMTGTAEDKFSPKDTTTRAQAAAVFVRTLQTLGMMD